MRRPSIRQSQSKNIKFQSVKIKKEPCIEIIQENSIDFLVQYIYLIYTRLMVYAI